MAGVSAVVCLQPYLSSWPSCSRDRPLCKMSYPAKDGGPKTKRVTILVQAGERSDSQPFASREHAGSLCFHEIFTCTQRFLFFFYFSLRLASSFPFVPGGSPPFPPFGTVGKVGRSKGHLLRIWPMEGRTRMFRTQSYFLGRWLQHTCRARHGHTTQSPAPWPAWRSSWVSEQAAMPHAQGRCWRWATINH